MTGCPAGVFSVPHIFGAALSWYRVFGNPSYFFSSSRPSVLQISVLTSSFWRSMAAANKPSPTSCMRLRSLSFNAAIFFRSNSYMTGLQLNRSASRLESQVETSAFRLAHDAANKPPSANTSDLNCSILYWRTMSACTPTSGSARRSRGEGSSYERSSKQGGW